MFELYPMGPNLTVKIPEASKVEGPVYVTTFYPVGDSLPTVLYHVTTPKKVRKYHASRCIHAPVRGFTNLTAALAWGCKIGRTVVLEVAVEECHKLPDHHNKFGEAWWIDHDVKEWKCIFSAEKDA